MNIMPAQGQPALKHGLAVSSCLAVPLSISSSVSSAQKRKVSKGEKESDWGLTSLERVLHDRLAEDTEACSCVRRHLDLILCPDDELGDEAVVDIRAGDILLLVLTREPRQPIPAVEGRIDGSTNEQLDTMISSQDAPSLAVVARGCNKQPSFFFYIFKKIFKTSLFTSNLTCIAGWWKKKKVKHLACRRQ